MISAYRGLVARLCPLGRRRGSISICRSLQVHMEGAGSTTTFSRLRSRDTVTRTVLPPTSNHLHRSTCTTHIHTVNRYVCCIGQHTRTRGWRRFSRARARERLDGQGVATRLRTRDQAWLGPSGILRIAAVWAASSAPSRPAGACTVCMKTSMREGGWLSRTGIGRASCYNPPQKKSRTGAKKKKRLSLAPPTNFIYHHCLPS